MNSNVVKPVQSFKFFMRYVSSYLTVDKNVWICSEKSGFCFSFFLVKLGYQAEQQSQNVVELVHYKAINSRLGLKTCFSDREILAYY